MLIVLFSISIYVCIFYFRRYGRRRNSTGSDSTSRDLSDDVIGSGFEGDFDNYDDEQTNQRSVVFGLSPRSCFERRTHVGAFFHAETEPAI